MPKAISYIRFSSGTQAKGSSTVRQQAMINDWLLSNPEYRLDTVLSRLDAGKSGYKGDHLQDGAGLHSIVEAIRVGLIASGDVLLIEALDRLGRLPATKMLTLFLNIIESGVTIITLEDEQEYNEATIKDQQSLLYILIGKVQAANDYSERLSRRVKAAWVRKIAKAKAGEAIKKVNPFWLDNMGKLDPDKAPLVLEAIDLYLSGAGYRAIGIALKGEFSFKTLKRMFRNRALIGEWETKSGEVIKTAYEPLLSIDKFHELQFVLTQREKTQAPPSSYVLSGLLVCNDCNKKLTIRVQKQEKAPILYCNCSSYLRNGSCTNSTTYDYSVLLSLFKDTFASFLTYKSNEWLETFTDKEREAQLKDDIASTKREIARLIELAQLVGRDLGQLAITLKDKNELLTSLEAELGELIQDQMSKEDIFNFAYSEASSLLDNPVKLNAILRNLEYQILCNRGECSVDFNGDTIFYKILRRVNIPALYLIEYYQLSDFFGRDLKVGVRYLAVNRFVSFEDTNFVNLIKTIKGDQATRWLRSIGRKEFPYLMMESDQP
ncbi:recombinase family protein [Marinomonas shanghaiensis]|uniref:recombinase family protein n=1 Tax=Marinomonas shanghaiensis TaxID=2202418 RepID=UPI003A9486BA